MTGNGPTVRDAEAKDAAACAAIYAPYVTDSVVSFEATAPSDAAMARRIEQAQVSHAWVVSEVDDAVVGYAYAGRFSDRPAYDWSCEVSVYVQLGQHRTGAGRALYEALFRRLVNRGFCTAFAALVPPHAASEGLHRSLGFSTVGTFHQVGWKFGEWRDVLWLQRRLIDGGGPPGRLS